jgi:hypothetical protein
MLALLLLLLLLLLSISHPSRPPPAPPLHSLAGPAAEEKLSHEGITTPFQLLGKYLSLRTKDMSVQEHCDAFFNWIAEVGINHQRHTIVRCIAEKANSMMPGLFNAAEVRQ